MTRYLLTSPKLPGHIELVYNDAGMVCLINLMDAQPNYEQLQKFIADLLPYHVDDMKQLPKTITVVKADFDITFDDFWKAYRKKVNRIRCEPIWAKMSREKQVKAVYTLKEYYRCLDRTGRKEADPETYLRNQYWETDWKLI